ncbi:MAG: type I-E CRISPR-associated protein Cas6/Cse3/CasE [Cellvibrio sp. 79]|nr:MAG: type I-E CRISPR-associated protein Cas6/Cse3/CasE [Cellvibrio sp. 79]
MYLSRIELTPAIAEYSQLGAILKDRSYGIHRLLWDLFAAQERFLFREENTQEQLNSRRRLPIYYVLSVTKPISDSPIFKIDSKEFSPKLNVGDQLAFKLRANPTIARKMEGKKNSQRHDVVMDAQRQFLISSCQARQLSAANTKSELRQLLLSHPDYSDDQGGKRLAAELDDAIRVASIEWIKKRGETHGYCLQSLEATGYRWNALPEKDRNAGFSSMDYEGILQVTDPERFAQMLIMGIGPSKAFGCGLMLIRRI